MVMTWVVTIVLCVRIKGVLAFGQNTQVKDVACRAE